MRLVIIGQKTHFFDCQGIETIEEIKETLASLENLLPEDIRIYAGGRPVSDDSITSEFEDVALEICVGLLGGKVHGSLARAGKVKGQTPKVDKQEKRKKKTGRAKKRMQYTKRFVNVPVTFGRRKGPNSNAV